MAVVINDFEITLEEPDAEAATAEVVPAEVMPAEKVRFRPLDMEDVQRQQFERLLRVWAH